MHLLAVYIEYSECLPTRLDPLAERTSFFQVPHRPEASSYQCIFIVGRGATVAGDADRL
jgi:hypothetical protein